MECLSLTLATSSKPCSDRSLIRFHSVSMMASSLNLANPSSSFSLSFRGASVGKRIQGVPPVGEATLSAETTLNSSTPRKKVLIPIGYGTEEMEAVILVHTLRQAGADVTVASVEPQLEVTASGGLKLVADASINSCSKEIFDLIALPEKIIAVDVGFVSVLVEDLRLQFVEMWNNPATKKKPTEVWDGRIYAVGGMPGSVRLRDCKVLQEITSKQAEEKRLYGAISTAPAVTLLPWGLLRRKRSTGHPAFMDKLPTFWAVKSNIQVSGELTTSRGPGTSFEFALSLVEQLFSESTAQEVRESLLLGSEDLRIKEEFNQADWSLDHPPHVLIPMANGSDEIEIVTIVDILRRAKVNVVIASVEKSLQILACQGTKILADKSIRMAAESTYDLIILPGGLDGVKKLSKSKVLKKLLKEQEAADRILGALCSSPELLQSQGLLMDKRITAHPSILNKLTCKVVDGAKVVIDGQLITSKGLATATDFALAIVTKLFGHGRARSVAEGLVFEYPRS